MIVASSGAASVTFGAERRASAASRTDATLRTRR